MVTLLQMQNGDRGSNTSQPLPEFGPMAPPNAGPLDPELIAGFRAGQADAIRVLYRMFSGAVATVARSIAGNDQALIDDIVQQTFTKAWRAASTFQQDRAFAPWLYTIARRTAIDAIRAERHPTRGDHEPEVDLGTEPLSLEKTWEAHQVKLAIDQLSPEEKQVVQMGHSIGMTHPEIANHLGIPVGTVKSRYFRAYRKLAANLAHLSNDPADPPNQQRGAVN